MHWSLQDCEVFHGSVGVYWCVGASPLQLGAPQDVLLPVHQDGKVLVLALLDGVGACGDSAHLAELHRGGHVSQQQKQRT